MRKSKTQKLIACVGSEPYWAHILWQRHGLRMEEFDAMPKKTKLFYIASEQYEGEHPCRLDTIKLKLR